MALLNNYIDICPPVRSMYIETKPRTYVQEVFHVC